LSDTFEIRGKVAKVDSKLGLVFGFGAVSMEKGARYFDAHDEHVSEAELLKGALNFVEHWQIAGEEHRDGASGEVEKRGTVPFVFPLLTDVAKALGIESETHGILVALKPDAEMMAKFESGELTGFSMGGVARRREVDDDG